MSAETPSKIHVSSIECFSAGAAAIEGSCVATSGIAIRGSVFFTSAAGGSGISEAATVSFLRLEESGAAALDAGSGIRAVSPGFMFRFCGLPGEGSGNSTVSFLDWFGPAMK